MACKRLERGQLSSLCTEAPLWTVLVLTLRDRRNLERVDSNLATCFATVTNMSANPVRR